MSKPKSREEMLSEYLADGGMENFATQFVKYLEYLNKNQFDVFKTTKFTKLIGKGRDFKQVLKILLRQDYIQEEFRGCKTEDDCAAVIYSHLKLLMSKMEENDEDERKD